MKVTWRRKHAAGWGRGLMDSTNESLRRMGEPELLDDPPRKEAASYATPKKRGKA